MLGRNEVSDDGSLMSVYSLGVLRMADQVDNQENMMALFLRFSTDLNVKWQKINIQSKTIPTHYIKSFEEEAIIFVTLR